MLLHSETGQIEFRDLNFCFPTRPNVPIFRNINFTIEPNKVTAIVGRSGSGKSTVAALLLRLYDPQSGGVYLDNIDIKKLNPNWLRSNIGAVSQEPVLFSGTIRDNILYGAKSDDDIKYAIENFDRVVQESYVDDFVKTLPDGYETMVGQRGMMLSGGQKQRVAIARALIRVSFGAFTLSADHSRNFRFFYFFIFCKKNPAILILDEATSALDSVSEALIQKSLENVSEGRTVLTIAHRLSTIRNAQKIIVIGSGSILEQGSYEELMAKKNGSFRNLVKQQTFESTPSSTDAATTV